VSRCTRQWLNRVKLAGNGIRSDTQPSTENIVIAAGENQQRPRHGLLLFSPAQGYGGYVAPIPFRRLFGTTGRRALESIVPRRTFDDVILPPATRRTLDTALAQVTQHDLIFNRSGLRERHPTGLALAFNFAGPSGTGKTICAEAIAHALGRPLLLVRYTELESLWMGGTAKNVAAIFRTARDERAVLLDTHPGAPRHPADSGWNLLWAYQVRRDDDLVQRVE